MKKLFWLAIFNLLVVVAAASGQTIAPPIAEFRAKPAKFVSGSFQVQNNELIPVAFTVESYRLTLDSQQLHFQMPDSGMQILLSQSSGRLGPKEIRRIDYKISCSSIPCQSAIKVGLITGRTKDGAQVRIIISHVVYLGSSKSPRQDALIQAGLLAKK